MVEFIKVTFGLTKGIAMAKNTKLLGFGSGNTVTLERWGEKVTEAMPGPAIEVLRKMCFEQLPKRPKEQRPFSNISYDEGSGTIRVELTSEEAGRLQGLIEDSVQDGDGRDTELAQLDDWHAGLAVALEDHARYHDTRDEPGVESKP